MDREALAILSRMNPTDVRRLLARVRKKADRKRARLVTRRSALARKIETLDRELARLGDGKAPRGVRSRRGSKREPRRGRVTVRDAAHAVLAKKSKPMKVRDLAKAVLSSGKVKSSSPAFAQNLGLAMRADKRFRKVGRGLYSVRPTAGG